MNTTELKDLIEVLHAKGYSYVDVKHEGTQITLSREPMQMAAAQAPVSMGMQSAPAPVAAAPVHGAADTSFEHKGAHVLAAGVDEADVHIVKSPIVGTFYLSASPESAPFAVVGQQVKKGQTLCIIEAMKLMNEIEADVSGELLEVLVVNEGIVEYGQSLFKIKKA